MHCKLKPGQRGILQQVYLTVTNTVDTPDTPELSSVTTPQVGYICNDLIRCLFSALLVWCAA